MMCMFYTTVLFCTWLIRSQVGAQIDDILNPVRVDLSVWHQRNARVVAQTDEQLNCERPNIYVCEEPPDTVYADSGKNCNYRNTWYPEQIFKWVAGRGCLLYTPDFLYVEGRNPLNLNRACIYGDSISPCLEIAKEDGTCGCYPFDPAFEEVASIVRNATVSSAHGRWEKCFYEASDCCNHYTQDTDHLNTDSSECQTTFDGWTCWHESDPGMVAHAVCSEFAYSNEGPTCHHFSSKECYSNGTWELMTDYATCSVAPRLLRRYWLYIGILAASTVACVPAVFIFIFYKRLRVTRVALHRNLLIAIIVRNILVIINRIYIYIGELTSTEDTVMSGNGGWCRALAVLERAAASAVFVCMLMEGIYLHRLIVAVFRTQWSVKWLYLLGTVLIIAPVTSWAVVMATYNDHSCWMVYTMPHIQWIVDAPRILILLINTALFADVLRVLLTKIRNSENASQLSTAKATLFLMPLFGVQFVFTAFRPNTTNCNNEQIYYYVAYTIEALQGFTVAMLFCYVNKEVHALIKETYKKTETAFTSRIRNSHSARVSNDPNDRRFTYSTNLPNQDENKDHNFKPKYVAEIISIQASERLAEILDPIYETIDVGVTNEGYDLERSDIDNDSGFIPNRNSKIDDYYGFTNASSISIGCRDWIEDTPTYGSHNAVDSYNPHIEIKKSEKGKENPENNVEYVDMDIKPVDEYADVKSRKTDDIELKPTGCDDMLEEIMQCINTNESDVKLNPNLLSPNRPEDEKIVFVTE